MNKTDKALELMRQNNADGLNNADIGLTLAMELRKADEALPYLSDALVHCVTELQRIVIGYANAYDAKGDHASGRDALAWLCGAIAGLMRPGVPSYLNREAVLLLTGCADMCGSMGDMEAARAYLREARDAAARFDQAPDYSFSGMRFYYGKTGSTGFDDFGETAMEGIGPALSKNNNEKTASALLALWDEVRQETGAFAKEAAK